MLYDDGKIALDASGMVIRRYYPWGAKHIPYGSIRSCSRLPLGVRRWRFWGSGDFRHWWNFDPSRRGKEVALDIDTGHRRLTHPAITPDDPQAVERILREHLG